MCADPACDGVNDPPPGETWCPRRLDVELWRWISGHPMQCGAELDLNGPATRA